MCDLRGRLALYQVQQPRKGSRKTRGASSEFSLLSVLSHGEPHPTRGKRLCATMAGAAVPRQNRALLPLLRTQELMGTHSVAQKENMELL
jgi:hypothetical protein